MMNKNILIICDKDKNYCKKLDSFIRDNLSIPFDIFEITDAERLSAFIDESKNILLLISQSIFDSVNLCGFKHILVLRENDKVLAENETHYGYKDADIRYTDKYQRSENITDSILSMCLDIPGIILRDKKCETQRKMKVIGFYTPVLNSDQTREAIGFARRNTEKEKTLYINTDSFCTHDLLRKDEYEETLLDLMYFAECADDKFGIYLERIVKHDKELDFIPAASNGCQSRLITAKEYGNLLKQIEDTGKYACLVVDIAEGVRELFEMLHMCDEIYMLSNDDYNAHMRIELFINELQRDEDFEMKNLHQINRIGGEVLGT
ncbi:hypothetical protein [Butyrivibrio sp. VCD2006]|uniref:hypothetical protein n=1 Tax=Butyrivibrio sp. VCD2006 TaxID=1280664 RepID=UPI00040088FA|nr:hypothetical protein [Butyrivibrio sp. VCD2006]